MTAPASTEAEKVLVGSVLYRPETWDLVSGVTPNEFIDPLWRATWEVFTDRKSRGERVDDAMAVEDDLRRRNWEQDASGRAVHDRLVEALESGRIPELVDGPRAMVQEAARLRRLMVVCDNAARRAQVEVPSEEVLAQLREDLAGIEGSSAERGPVRLGDALSNVLDAVRVRAQPANDALPSAIYTRCKAFDDHTGGLKPGNLVIVAGRPGMGKTALADCWAAGVAWSGVPTLVFSLEMTLQEQAERILSGASHIGVSDIGNGNLSDMDLDRLAMAGKRVGTWPLYIDDRTHTVQSFVSTARQWHARTHRGAEKRAFIVLDYAGLIRFTGRSERRDLEVAQVSAACKSLAKELACPVVLLSQLNRLSERENRKPILSDLRESGSLEQDADLVVFPYREPPLDRSGPAELIIAKFRGGAPGSIPAYWEAETTEYRDVISVPNPQLRGIG